MTNEELILHCNNCHNFDKCSLAFSDDLQNIDCEYYIPLANAVKEYCENKIYEALTKCIKENQMMFEEHLKMGYEIEEKWPKKIKVTSKFANYLDTQCAQLSDKPKKPPKGGIVVQLTGIPIEIDDAIKSEYYEFVY